MDELLSLKLSIVDVLNRERGDVHASTMEFDELMSEVAQSYLEEDCLVLSDPRRYSERGSHACVTEQLYDLCVDGASTKEELLRAFEEALMKSDEFHLKVSHHQVGVGIVATEGVACRVVCAYSTQFVILKHPDEIDITGTISGHVTPNYAPYACVVTHKEKSGPATYVYNHPGSQEVEDPIAVVWPWDIHFNKSDLSFSFDLKIDHALQRKGIFAIPDGVFQICIYVSHDADAVPYHTPGSIAGNLDLKGLSCASSSTLAFPTAGSRAVQEAKYKRQISVPVEKLLLVTPGQVVPELFEVYPQPASRLPQFCVSKGDSGSCLVELAVAFGSEDVPPGFEAVCDAVKGEPVNLRRYARLDYDEENDEEPIFLCTRFSDDESEISSRGISQVTFSCEDNDFMERLDVLPGTLQVLYRLTGMGTAYNFGTEGDEEEEVDIAHEHSEWNHSSILEMDQLGECVLPSVESKQAELEETERTNRLNQLQKLIDEAQGERQRLVSINQGNQKDLVPVLMFKQMQIQVPEVRDEMGIAEKERCYANSLNTCADAKETLQRTQDGFDTIAMSLQAKFQEKDTRAKEIRDSFAHFKREISKVAENTRTGKPIPGKIVAQFQEAELAKDAEMEKMRLKNINLRSMLRKLEGELHEKEKLAEGLHLIDFEQLKIENQTLNEKIEERNEELHKLRKKTTTTVQVLTHIKEKLQYVQRDTSQLIRDLDVLDKEVTTSRDQLTKCKQSRDSLKSVNETRKRESGFVNSTLLVDDFQGQKSDIEALKRKVRDLKQKHTNLTGSFLKPSDHLEEKRIE